jgi:hypothetical protein
MAPVAKIGAAIGVTLAASTLLTGTMGLRGSWDNLAPLWWIGVPLGVAYFYYRKLGQRLLAFTALLPVTFVSSYVAFFWLYRLSY